MSRKFTKIEGVREVSTRNRSIEDFQALFPRAVITAIDGDTTFAFCETCGAAIVPGDECRKWEENSFTCPSHDLNGGPEITIFERAE